LHNIFTWRPGERILNPEFGSRLYTLLYEGITPETEERIAAEIRSCVSEWEPRVQITEIRDISTIDETENNTIHLEVIFIIPSLSNE
jgi:phage baseplate assembly protein W